MHINNIIYIVSVPTQESLGTGRDYSLIRMVGLITPSSKMGYYLEKSSSFPEYPVSSCDVATVVSVYLLFCNCHCCYGNLSRWYFIDYGVVVSKSICTPPELTNKIELMTCKFRLLSSPLPSLLPPSLLPPSLLPSCLPPSFFPPPSLLPSCLLPSLLPPLHIDQEHCRGSKLS